jgi:hypothetical protein
MQRPFSLYDKPSCFCNTCLDLAASRLEEIILFYFILFYFILFYFIFNVSPKLCFSNLYKIQMSVKRNYFIIKLHLTFGTGVLHLIQINQQPDATIFQFIILTFVCRWTCFGRFPAHRQELNNCSGTADTEVIELLMMGGKTPETCWAVNKRQDNKLKNYCIRLVIYLNCTMMRGLTDLKFYI